MRRGPDANAPATHCDAFLPGTRVYDRHWPKNHGTVVSVGKGVIRVRWDDLDKVWVYGKKALGYPEENLRLA